MEKGRAGFQQKCCKDVCLHDDYDRPSHHFNPLLLHWDTFHVNLFMADSPEIVQYSYRAEKDDEIDLEIGEVVQVFEKCEDGRCKGVIGEREGWFPGNCTRERTYNCSTIVYHLYSVLPL